MGDKEQCPKVRWPIVLDPPGWDEVYTEEDVKRLRKEGVDKSWDPLKHPRAPRGTHQGGQFVSRGARLVFREPVDTTETVLNHTQPHHELGTVMASPTLKASLDEVESKLVGQPFERAVAMSPTGVVFFEKGGDASSIALEQDEAAATHGAVLTHNHPADSLGFSPEDIQAAAVSGVAQLRAVTRDGISVIEPPPSGWDEGWWVREGYRAFWSANAQVHRDTAARLSSGEVTREWANKNHWKMVAEKFAAMTGARFHMEPAPRALKSAAATLSLLSVLEDPGLRLKSLAVLPELRAACARFGIVSPDWLRRPVTKAMHEFASTQLDCPPPLAGLVVALGKQLIPEEELAAKGREEEPHITVRFGLHEGDPEAVAELVGSLGPVEVQLGPIGVFEADDYDVVFISAQSELLRQMNARLADLEHTDTQPVYHPHLTLAYVKRGAGAKYAGREDFLGDNLTFHWLSVCGKDGKKVLIPLGAAGAVTKGYTHGYLYSRGGRVVYVRPRFGFHMVRNFDKIRHPHHPVSDTFADMHPGDFLPTDHGLTVARTADFGGHPWFVVGPQQAVIGYARAIDQSVKMRAEAPTAPPEVKTFTDGHQAATYFHGILNGGQMGKSLKFARKVEVKPGDWDHQLDGMEDREHDYHIRQHAREFQAIRYRLAQSTDPEEREALVRAMRDCASHAQQHKMARYLKPTSAEKRVMPRLVFKKP